VKAITIYRRETLWDSDVGGSFDTLDAALLNAAQSANAEAGPVQIDLAHCNRTTFAFDPDAQPFVVAWHGDGTLIHETDL
jgi:hypothetical protein